ncbi:replication protein [Peribacillus frigoritolerans]|uniref:replication protein n=1 Tax=Peribacillus frigoritolerans TaxID=450367 RepID=UPI0030173145
MADVQLENGYTRVANEILEAIQMYTFTTNQLKIIMAVWRNTYGYTRKKHDISLGFLEGATYLTRARISSSLKSLVDNKVILEIQKGGGSKSKVLAFNKDYDQWTIKKYANCFPVGSLQDDTTPSLQDDTSGGLQDDTKERKKKVLKKKTYFNLAIEDDSFFKIYCDQFFNKFNKQHKQIPEDKVNDLVKQIQYMKNRSSIGEFEEIVEYHLDNLPSGNNGDIRAFVHAFPRYLEELKPDGF